jgi:hypothetical protein
MYSLVFPLLAKFSTLTRSDNCGNMVELQSINYKIEKHKLFPLENCGKWTVGI